MKPEYVPTYTMDKDNFVYAYCKCELPASYIIKMPKIEGKNRYEFHCDICGTRGVVYTEGEVKLNDL